jgi:hypothetical protein
MLALPIGRVEVLRGGEVSRRDLKIDQDKKNSPGGATRVPRGARGG